MKRITKRDEFGNADIKGVDSDDLQANLGFEQLNLVTEALNRLADYEDTMLAPDLCREYGRARCEGRIAILPFKVGSTVYWIGMSRLSVIKGKAEAVRIRKLNADYLTVSESGNESWREADQIFRTREEAEARLKEMTRKG